MDIFGGPQTDVPVGNTETAGNNNGTTNWQGRTIKDILDNVDLFHFTMLNEEDGIKLKERKAILEDAESKPQQEKSQPKSAFLGPQIWKNSITLNQLADDEEIEEKKPISVNVPSAEFSVMNIEDFLAENNFDNVGNVSPKTKTEIYDDESRGIDSQAATTTIRLSDYRIESGRSGSEVSDYSVIDADTATERNTYQEQSSRSNKRKIELPKGDNSFLYAESKRARIEREKEERRRREEARIVFSAEELALATVPGADFDPQERQFSIEELKPQPIIRKRQKKYVMPEKKDEMYWERRNKNNVAARRSREARRLKENQISLRTAFLQQQNASLKAAVKLANEKNTQLILDNKILTQKLKRYETMSPFSDLE